MAVLCVALVGIGAAPVASAAADELQDALGLALRGAELASDWSGGEFESITRTTATTIVVTENKGVFDVPLGVAVPVYEYRVTTSSGTFGVVTLLTPQPLISVYRMVDGGPAVLGPSWQLGSMDPGAPVVGETVAPTAAPQVAASGGWSPLACSLAIGLLGSLACPASAGATCAVVASLVSGGTAYALCQDSMPSTEGIQVTEFKCGYSYCDVKITVRTFGSASSSVSAYAWWDAEPNVDYFIGAVPCSPSCGKNYSISGPHAIGNRTAGTTYPVPTADGSFRTLREYNYSGRMWGGPECFVDTTRTVTAFFSASFNGRTGGTEHSSVKPRTYCDY